MKLAAKLEDDVDRMLHLITAWGYPIPWSPKYLAASVCVRAEHEGEPVGYVWLAPQEFSKGVWAIHIIFRKDVRGRWFTPQNWQKFQIILELLDVRTLVIEHYQPVTKRLARFLGAQEVADTMSFLDLEAADARSSDH